MCASVLNKIKQQEPQIFQYWSVLDESQKALFEKQLTTISLEKLAQQKEILKKNNQPSDVEWQAFNDFEFAGQKDNQMLGQQLIKEGRLGCLLLAGGQGTRLKFNGPKGCYPLSLIKQKSLFQLCAEKIKAASLWANRPLYLAIMTSPDNDEDTRNFFQKHHYFGLDPSQLDFFIQDTLPLLDIQGHLFLKNAWQIATGSDGNGHSLLCFAKAGLLNKWMQKGIEYVNIIPIDNPLADPFDAELVGFHQKRQSEISIKCTEKVRPDENLGVLIKQQNSCRVIEYSELPEEEKHAFRSDGRLKHCCGNLSLFCMSLSFIQHMALTKQTLPLHKAWKATSYLNSNGITEISTQPIAWKFETFIFDWLAYTSSVHVLIYPRADCFAPLKNLTGYDSADTVRKAIQHKEARMMQSLTGLLPPSFSFELAAEFYYPTPELQSKWQGQAITNPYVEPSLF